MARQSRHRSQEKLRELSMQPSPPGKQSCGSSLFDNTMDVCRVQMCREHQWSSQTSLNNFLKFQVSMLVLCCLPLQICCSERHHSARAKDPAGRFSCHMDPAPTLPALPYYSAQQARRCPLLSVIIWREDTPVFHSMAHALAGTLFWMWLSSRPNEQILKLRAFTEILSGWGIMKDSSCFTEVTIRLRAKSKRQIHHSDVLETPWSSCSPSMNAQLLSERSESSLHQADDLIDYVGKWHTCGEGVWADEALHGLLGLELQA